MKWTLLTIAILALVSFTLPVAGQTISVFGNVGLQAISSDAPTSWIEGGFGRLQGGTDGEEADEALIGELNLGLEWLPSATTAVFVHGLARGETQAREDWTAGIVEAWGEALFHLDSIHEFRLRAGTMILPTSRENTGEFWTSPYLVSFSSINSWIAEEVRPTGIDVQYRRDDGTNSVRVAATGFVGNDAAGTLLGWRGWSVGNRLTTFDEELPLPPLFSLRDGFPMQKPGTTPYGRDLDGRIGWAARARFDRWNRLTVQATHYDNRGDRDIHGDQYAWQTSFDLLGLEFHPGAGFTIISEYITGETQMGPSVGTRVELDFESVYVLASYSRGWFRISGRYDSFSTTERDFSPAENNDEDGDATAIAIAIQPNQVFRAAIELLDVDVERSAALESGAQLQNGGDAILVQFRYSF